MSAAIDCLERLKRTYEAARDVVQPAEPLPYHTQGLRAGLQIAIDGIERELRFLAAASPVPSIADQGKEAAREFDQDFQQGKA